MKKLYKQYKRVKAAIKDLTQAAPAAPEKSRAQSQQKLATRDEDAADRSAKDQNEDKADRPESDMQIDPANDVMDEAYTSIKINFADDQSSSENEKGSDAGEQGKKLRESSAVKMEMDVGDQAHNVNEADDDDDDDDISVKSRKRRRIADSDESDDDLEEATDLREDVLDEEMDFQGMDFQGNGDSEQDQDMDIEWTGTVSRPSHVEEEVVVIDDGTDTLVALVSQLPLQMMKKRRTRSWVLLWCLLSR